MQKITRINTSGILVGMDRGFIHNGEDQAHSGPYIPTMERGGGKLLIIAFISTQRSLQIKLNWQTNKEKF